MSWLKELFSIGGGKFLEGADKILGKWVSDADKRVEMKKEILDLINTQMGWVASEIDANMQVTLAEIQQDDKVTKWGRPSIVYSGILMVLLETVFRAFMVYSVWPAEATVGTITELMKSVGQIPSIVPGVFWAAWTPVVAVYGIGRSIEKSGMGGKIGKLAAAVGGSRVAKRFHKLVEEE